MEGGPIEGVRMGLDEVGPHNTQGEGAANSCKSLKKIYFAINIANAPVILSTCICQNPLHLLLPTRGHKKYPDMPFWEGVADRQMFE